MDTALIGSGSYRQDAVRVAALEMLGRADRPTAVFAANDISALEIIKVAAELGLDVPQDLSIIGFDDVPEASAARPALSTVRQPMQRLGAEAARMLLSLMRVRCSRPRISTCRPDSCRAHERQRRPRDLR